MKLLRKWATASGADYHGTVQWWKGLDGPERERASAEMRRRMAPKAGAAK